MPRLSAPLLVSFFCIFIFAAIVIANDRPPSIEPAILEKQIHARINEERQKRNLLPLSWNKEFAAIARHHSREMARLNFFSHTNSEDEEPVDRLQKNGYTSGKDFYAIGENIFEINLVQSIQATEKSVATKKMVYYRNPNDIARETVEGWMNSQGHRKNILNPKFDKEGIGIAISQEGNVYVTELLIKTTTD